LASNKIICSACCGSKRGTEINCASDCGYSPFSIKGYDLWLKTDSNLARKILRYIADIYGRRYFEETMEHMSFKGSTPEHVEAAAVGAAAYYILFVERGKDKQTLAERWKNTNWEGLTNDEKAMMNCRLNCRATIIEIQKILDTQRMECIDLLNPEKSAFILIDRSTARTVTRFTRLFTWLTHYPYFSRPENNGVIITDFIFQEFMDIIQEEFEKKSKKQPDLAIKDYVSENFGALCELTFNLANDKTTAVLKRADVYQCKAFYLIEGTSAYDEIKAILDTYPDFNTRERNPEEKHIEGAHYYSWLRKGDSKALEKQMNSAFRHDDETHGVGTLGNVTLCPDKLIIETFSKQKYAFAKKMVKKYFKRKVTLQNEAIVDLAKQLAIKKENGDEPLDRPFPKYRIFIRGIMRNLLMSRSL
jgi:hypothetical protein